MSKVGLVLEGGGMRGMWTAGVLDVFLDNNLEFDGIFGVSAGALFGVNYYSKQRGRVIRYSKRFCKDQRYMGALSYIFTGNAINKNFAYYRVSNELDPFDDETYMKNPGSFYAVVTNMRTGEAEYKKINSCLKEMETLRASSAVPLSIKPVKIGNDLYQDGAVSDSIPVLKCKEMGFEKIVIVLTRPIEYRKPELDDKTVKKIEKKFKDYPKFVESMKNRAKTYNKTLDIIVDMESKKEVFVLRPSKPLDIKLIERDESVIQKMYELGMADAQKIIQDLKKYLCS